MLFTVYSRFVPNLTRQDGSAIDRLLATRFASGNGVGAASKSADTAANDSCLGQEGKSGHPAQPPPKLLAA
jgi:integrase